MTIVHGCRIVIILYIFCCCTTRKKYWVEIFSEKKTTQYNTKWWRFCNMYSTWMPKAFISLVYNKKWQDIFHCWQLNTSNELYAVGFFSLSKCWERKNWLHCFVSLRFSKNEIRNCNFFLFLLFKWFRTGKLLSS